MHGSLSLIRDDDWFERACEMESAGRMMDAARAYEKAITCGVEVAEAHFNLANVWRALGRRKEAARSYRRALHCDPMLAAAWYNLADLHDEMNECAQATQCLENAVAIDPCYADAHFNLARCYEREGRLADAARHWRRYLQFDRHSAWAREACHALSSCEHA